MSKLLISLALAPTKALVNAYTWSTLPFYAITQRPWSRLKMSKSFGVKSTIDASGRVIYSRPSPALAAVFQNPMLKCYSFNEIIPMLNRNRQVIGTRDVLKEENAVDKNGNPVTVDGRNLTKLTLADEYKWLTVGEVLDRVDALARGFQQMGIKSGDKVCIFADNSLEWVCTSFAFHRINAVSITLLSILNNEGLAYCINQCEARYLITSQDLLTKRVYEISEQIQSPLIIVYIENKLKLNDKSLNNAIEHLNAKKYQISKYSEIQQNGYKIPPVPFPIPKPTDPALIMFTSGTTGNPKGVIFTHRQIADKLHNYMIYDHELEEPWFKATHLAYLPMSHIMGYMLNFCLFIFDGRMAICTPATLMDSSPAHVKGQIGDIRLVKPNYITAVPLMLERFMKEIYKRLNEQGQLAEPLFTYFMNYKIRWRARGFDTPIINWLISKKFNEQFGGKLKTILVGSAPLNQQTEALVQAAMNVALTQGYGSTEMSGGSHLTHEKDLSYGNVGIPFHSVKFYMKGWEEGNYYPTDKPNPRGEIVVGGHVISQGYFKLPQETKEAFYVDKEGTRWFESGDIGELLPNGTLKIIDRKKDLTKLVNGEFVSLGKIESGLRTSPFIENICVCTDPFSNYVTALISPNRQALTQLASNLTKNKLTFQQLIDDFEIQKYILDDIQQTGKKLDFSKKEIPVAIKLVTEEWNQNNNMLTPAMKLKRKQVNTFYAKKIKRLFENVDSK